MTWDNVDVVHKGETVSIHGNGFSGIARLTFLNLLQRRARALGVDVRFHTAVADPADLLDCDLLLGADGANSLVRRTWSDFFQPSVDVRRNRYIWLGTEQLFHGLVMIFREAPAGLFIAHAYKFSPTTSTFIVECGPEAWTRAGFRAHVRGRDLPLPRAGVRGRPGRAAAARQSLRPVAQLPARPQPAVAPWARRPRRRRRPHRALLDRLGHQAGARGCDRARRRPRRARHGRGRAPRV